MDEMKIGYLCPVCGKGASGVFPLTGTAAVGCACGRSALDVQWDGGRVQLHVPCGICGGTHRASFTREQLQSGRGLALGCASTKQFCCFAGSGATVTARLKELEILAAKEQRQQEDGETAFSDSVIMYEVLSELKEIAARRDGIVCGCGSRQYGMEIRRSCVDLICRRCGARLRIPAVTDGDLEQLCCRLRLTIPGVPAVP